ncbi:hypothetical protein [Frankia sp. AiPs1]
MTPRWLLEVEQVGPRRPDWQITCCRRHSTSPGQQPV